MMNMLKLFFLCLILVSLDCIHGVVKSPPPDALIPSAWQDEPVIVLSDSTDLEVRAGPKGNILIENRLTWYKINKPTPMLLKSLQFNYSLYLEEKPSITVDVIYTSGPKLHRMGMGHGKNYRYNNDLRRDKAAVNALYTSISDYSNAKLVRVTETHLIHRAEEFGRYLLRGDYPTLRKTITLRWPSSMSLNYGLANGESLPIDTVASMSPSTGLFTVRCDTIKGLGVLHCKFPESWYAALHISFPPEGPKSFSWNELGERYLTALTDSSRNQTQPVLDSIAGLLSAPSEDSLIATAFNYVQQTVRYYGSWEDSYGWIPRNPAEILKNGYGDCKEMATVLTFLLNKKKVTAWPVLVNTTGFQYTVPFPSFSDFNHCIVCVEKRDGRRIYLDPTNKYASGMSSCSRLIGQKTLVMRKNSSFPDSIAPPPGYRNAIETDSKFSRASPTSPWKQSGTVRLNGTAAQSLFDYLKNRQEESGNTIVKDWFKETLCIAASSSEIVFLARDSMVLSFETDAAASISVNTPQVIFFNRPALVTPANLWSDLSYEGDRYLSQTTQTDTWTVPAEYTRAETAPLRHRFGSGKWTIAGNKVTRSYSCEFNRISAEHRDTLKQFFKERAAFANGTIWAQ